MTTPNWCWYLSSSLSFWIFVKSVSFWYSLAIVFVRISFSISNECNWLTICEFEPIDGVWNLFFVLENSFKINYNAGTLRFIQLYFRHFASGHPQLAHLCRRLCKEFFPHFLHLICVWAFECLPIDGVPLVIREHLFCWRRYHNNIISTNYNGS